MKELSSLTHAHLDFETNEMLIKRYFWELAFFFVIIGSNMVINQFMVHAYMKFMKYNNNFSFYIIRKTKIFHNFLREEKLDEGV